MARRGPSSVVSTLRYNARVRRGPSRVRIRPSTVDGHGTVEGPHTRTAYDRRAPVDGQTGTAYDRLRGRLRGRRGPTTGPSTGPQVTLERPYMAMGPYKDRMRPSKAARDRRGAVEGRRRDYRGPTTGVSRRRGTACDHRGAHLTTGPHATVEGRRGSSRIRR